VTDAQKPRPAATVILLRPSKPTGFEVFLTRRPEHMPFLGGMYCFPGGGVNSEDFSAEVIARCSGVTPDQAHRIVGAQFRPLEALGFWIAAVRELFEEVGILLAVSQSGTPVTMDETQAHRIAEKHRALLGKSLTFLSLLESENLGCDLSRLGYFSHWQTPEQNSMRFDTRFFIAGLPENQTPLPTSFEVAHSLWLAPDRAIGLFERGELPLIFPTFASLRTLADFETLESVFKEFRPGSPAE
jgi:8-oxo-dGTP pyrophosphatase MutT (NUDIX family)